jgi:hypothetical protein
MDTQMHANAHKTTNGHLMEMDDRNFCGFDIIGWKLRVGGWQQNIVVFHGNN